MGIRQRGFRYGSVGWGWGLGHIEHGRGFSFGHLGHLAKFLDVFTPGEEAPAPAPDWVV